MKMMVQHRRERKTNFKEHHIPRNSNATKLQIITNITFFINNITYKSTLNRLINEFVTFMRSKMYKTNTTKSTKIKVRRRIPKQLIEKRNIMESRRR